MNQSELREFPRVERVCGRSHQHSSQIITSAKGEEKGTEAELSSAAEETDQNVHLGVGRSNCMTGPSISNDVESTARTRVSTKDIPKYIPPT